MLEAMEKAERPLTLDTRQAIFLYSCMVEVR